MRRGAASLFLGRVVSALATVVVLALVARSSTLEELGVVALGLTVGLVLAVLSEAGLTALFIYDIAGAPGRSGRLLGAMLVIRAVTLPAVGLVIVVLVGVAYPEYARTITIVGLAPALQQVSELARSVFIARGRMAIAAGHSIVENLAWASVIAVGLQVGIGLDATFGFAAAAVAASAVMAFVLVAALERVWPVVPSRSDIGGLLRQAGPFTAFSVLAVVGARMDTVLIALLLPEGVAAAGAYYTVARLAAAAEYLPEAVSRAIYPSLVRDYATDRHAATAILASASRDLLAIAIAAPLGFIVAGAALVGVLFGPEIALFAWILVGFGLAMPFRYVGMLFGWALTAAGRQDLRLAAMAIGVGVSLVLTVALLPIIGVAGALLAAIAGWVVNCLVLSPGVLASFGRVIVAQDVFRSAAVAGGAFVVAIAVRALVHGTIGALAAGLVFGLIVLGATIGPRRGTRVPRSGAAA